MLPFRLVLISSVVKSSSFRRRYGMVTNRPTSPSSRPAGYAALYSCWRRRRRSSTAASPLSVADSSSVLLANLHTSQAHAWQNMFLGAWQPDKGTKRCVCHSSPNLALLDLRLASRRFHYRLVRTPQKILVF